MNSVAQFLSSTAVLLDLDAPNKQVLFESVGRLWEERYGMPAADVVDRLNAREKLGSTGLGHGVAIPHARVKGLAEPVSAFVRLKTGIGFDSPDGSPVSCCFLMLAPEHATEQHLRILAAVAEKLSSGKVRDRLGASQDPDEVRHLFAA